LSKVSAATVHATLASRGGDFHEETFSPGSGETFLIFPVRKCKYVEEERGRREERVMK
jgi:hypothetical protein